MPAAVGRAIGLCGLSLTKMADHLYPPGACSKKGLTIVTRGPVGSFPDRDSGSQDLARLEQLRREWFA